MCKITTIRAKNKKKSQKYFIIILLRLFLLYLTSNTLATRVERGLISSA